MNFPDRRTQPSLWAFLAFVALAAVGPTGAATDRAPARNDEISGRALDVLHRNLAEKTSWEQTHAADALIVCGDGEAVHRRYQTEAEKGEPPFRTAIWRMMALTASDGPERLRWISKLEGVLSGPEVPDRFTAVEVLCKLHHRLSGPALAAARRMTADPVQVHTLFGWWALAVRGEPGALETIAAALRSRDASVRAEAGSNLRWLRPDAPGILAELARAANAEAIDSPAFTSVVGAAVILDADPGRRQAWRAGLEEIVRRGPGRPRWSALQPLMLGYTRADIPKVERFLDAPDLDSRTGAAWTILHLTGRPARRRVEEK